MMPSRVVVSVSHRNRSSLGQKKGKYIYYHCTFSKGRHRDANAYVREDRLARLFEDSVRRVTISEEKISWVKTVLAESGGKRVKIHEQQMASLQSQRERIGRRLSSLYDLKIDGNIDEDTFRSKEREYRSHLTDFDIAIEQGQGINQKFYEDGCSILELSNRLYPLYLRSDVEDKARILRLIASNYSLSGQTISPTYRKPFDLIAEGVQKQKWLPKPSRTQYFSGEVFAVTRPAEGRARFIHQW